jgi:hypothetical protein
MGGDFEDVKERIMRLWLKRGVLRMAGLAAGGTVFFLEGCDSQLRATVENGIITTTSSLLGAVLRAAIELAEEEAAAASARVLVDVAERVLA